MTSKEGLDKRLSKLEERTGINPVRIIEMTDSQLENIVGGHLTDEQLEELARGSEIVIYDDIRGGDV